MSRNDAIAASLDYHYTEKDSPQPHVPLILGLLKTNSEASLEKDNLKTDVLIQSNLPLQSCSTDATSFGCFPWPPVIIFCQGAKDQHFV